MSTSAAVSTAPAPAAAAAAAVPAPVPPRSQPGAYLVYVRMNRPRVLHQYPGLTHSQIGGILGREWWALSGDELAKYGKLAAEMHAADAARRAAAAAESDEEEDTEAESGDEDNSDPESDSDDNSDCETETDDDEPVSRKRTDSPVCATEPPAKRARTNARLHGVEVVDLTD